MTEIEYYDQIKNIIENYEVNQKVRFMQDNHEKLLMNWTIGKLLVDAQGGMSRAKYGDSLIKKWSISFMRDYGMKYNIRELRRMRQFYLLYPKWSAVRSVLSWTHYRILISNKNENERKFVKEN